MSLPKLTRRRLLGTAAAGAAGVAAARVLPAQAFTAAHARAAATPAGPWAAPFATASGRAAHLLRRATFGYTTAELAAAAAMPYRDLVESLLNQQPQRPTYTSATQQRGRWDAGPVWLTHMGTTTAQFPERMTLFWHGLLTSGADKQPFEFNYMVLQNQLFRDYGLSDLRTLLVNTALSGAMLEYLDMQQSTVGAPNENFAREVMELFTLGPGTYTEADVRESARALTGYRTTAFNAAGVQQPWPQWFAPESAYVAHIESLISAGWTFRGVLVPKLHDNTTKTFLGRTGNWKLEDIIDTILAQPACAPFVARKAIAYFGGDALAADTAFVTQVANRFRASGYDIKTLMRCIFLGGDHLATPGPMKNRFLAADAYRAGVRGPVEFVLAAVRATGWTTILKDTYWYTETMGQSIYEPPNVAGWHGGAGWLGSTAWLQRLNFASAVGWDGRATNPDPDVNLQSQLDGVISDATRATYRGLTWAGDRWFVLLGSPEFHLK